MASGVPFGTKVTFGGLLILLIGGIFFFINCDGVIAPGYCHDWRNIPIISDLMNPFMFIGLGMFILGIVIHIIQTSGKTELPPDEGN